MSGRGHGISAARSGSFGPKKTGSKTKGRERFRGKPEPTEPSDAPDEETPKELVIFKIVGKSAEGEEISIEKIYKTEKGAKAFLENNPNPGMEGDTDWVVAEMTVPAE